MTTTTTQVIKIEQIPGKPVLVYTERGLIEVIQLGVLSWEDINALPMTTKARKYWDLHNLRRSHEWTSSREYLGLPVH